MKLCECGCGALAPLAKRTKASRGEKKGEPLRFIHGHNGAKTPVRVFQPNPDGLCQCGCGKVTPLAPSTNTTMNRCQGQHQRFVVGHGSRTGKISRPSHVTLRHGDPIPAGIPDRSVEPSGYVSLRWLVAPRTYVMVREHRLVMGVPPSHLHVHHINGIRHDNRPENLKILNPHDHFEEHVTFDMDAALADYNAGMSLPQVGRKHGVHSTNIMRALKRRRGLVCRPKPGSKPGAGATA